jgi:uroporphyrinogen III methyltransferase/synthase
VVPGVTAAVAVASHAGIPLTHRDCASAVALVTGHRRADEAAAADFDYESLGGFPGTLVFYMAVTSAKQWSDALLRGGRLPETPVAIVRRVSWPDQEVICTTLGQVAEVIQQRELRPPAVIVVGEVVGRSAQGKGTVPFSGECGAAIPDGGASAPENRDSPREGAHG